MIRITFADGHTEEVPYSLYWMTWVINHMYPKPNESYTPHSRVTDYEIKGRDY